MEMTMRSTYSYAIEFSAIALITIAMLSLMLAA
jgi:hypothetical protein